MSVPRFALVLVLQNANVSPDISPDRIQTAFPLTECLYVSVVMIDMCGSWSVDESSDIKTHSETLRLLSWSLSVAACWALTPSPPVCMSQFPIVHKKEAVNARWSFTAAGQEPSWDQLFCDWPQPRQLSIHITVAITLQQRGVEVHLMDGWKLLLYYLILYFIYFVHEAK